MAQLLPRRGVQLTCKLCSSLAPKVESSTKTRNIKTPHEPVLVEEILKHLMPKPGQIFIDMTFGAGGHSKALLKACPDLTIFALDQDPLAMKYANDLSSISNGHVVPVKGRFSKSEPLLTEAGCIQGKVDGVIMDLGASSMQMDSPERGFGRSSDAYLDMRMSDGPNIPSAAEIVNGLGAPELAHIFKAYGEERFGRRIANAIVEHRNTVGPLRTTRQLSDLVNSVVANLTSKTGGRSLANGEPINAPTSHVSTRVFQALRIFVNDELNELCSGLAIAQAFLRPTSGLAAAISFHSLEDRLIKQAFTKNNATTPLDHYQTVINNSQANVSPQKPLWRHVAGPIRPSTAEVLRNNRCRSAKLRIAEKC